MQNRTTENGSAPNVELTTTQAITTLLSVVPRIPFLRLGNFATLLYIAFNLFTGQPINIPATPVSGPGSVQGDLPQLFPPYGPNTPERG